MTELAPPINPDAAEMTSQTTDPVATLLAEEFNHPAQWQGDRDVFSVVYDYSNTRHPQGSRRYVATGPSRPWLAAAYGVRIVSDPEHADDHGVRAETSDLDTMVAIHERLRETVLQDEHAHTSVLVDSPEPGKGTRSIANNNAWLETIRDGRWPIMTTGTLDEQGRKEYFSHDSTDYHTGNMVYMPKELQGLMSTAAGHELLWRAQFPTGRSESIKGDDGRDDPYASGFRGNSDHTDGISKIDNLSDTHSYFPLLRYMMEGESGEAQLAALKAYMEAKEAGADKDPQIDELAVDVARLQRVMGDLLNFNTLHALNRTTTQEEIAKAMEAVLHGTARVADKLQGRPAANAADISPLSPEPMVTPEEPAEYHEEVGPDSTTGELDDPYEITTAETTSPSTRKRRGLGRLAIFASPRLRRKP